MKSRAAPRAGVVRIKAGRERSFERRHPWIFSGAIDGEPTDIELGATVRVESADGAFLAQAAWSPHSQIRARVWTWGEERVDAAFIAARVEAAVARRGGVRAGRAARLVNGEADGVPGVIVDHYADSAVVQLLSAGAEHWRSVIAEAVRAAGSFVRVYERSDADVRELEGLPTRVGPISGDAPPGPIEFIEAAEDLTMRFAADVLEGHKTGFYLDQSANRAAVGRLARGAEVLNCFAYTGGFAIAALAAGARHATSIESSACLATSPIFIIGCARWGFAIGMDAP